MSDIQLYLDDPAQPTVTHPMEYLWGWIKVPDSSGEFDVRIRGERPQFARIRRRELNPSLHVGFLVFVDMLELAERGKASAQESLVVEFFLDGELIASLPMNILASASDPLPRLLEDRRTKRAFIESNARRPLNRLEGCRAPSALPDDWSIDPRMSAKTDAISAHHYGPSIYEFLNTLPPDAMILEAGAGFRRNPVPNVINMEIYDYPSTDILCIGQDLPFRDDSFDAVLSIAVLEHVDDPFLCAQEIMRVLKPGGKLYCSIPFLQAEHGYPSHYFNCTRFGMRRLFADLQLDQQFMELSNQPIFTLHQILGLYAHGLRDHPQIRERFLKMTVEELIREAPVDRWLRNEDIITALDPEDGWKIAWGTTAVFSKPSSLQIAAA
ncbi:methyltransferase domain-containing protein [Tautonia sp. JC769]|uniref:methyltransferase domain-containing protein n=1 Tax=Tautonia sp. JC769 TaxID=3232135 RepID=UPI003459D404